MEATVTCPNGHVNPVGTEFCAECGQSLVVDKTSVWSVSELSSQFQEQASGGGTTEAPSEADEDEPAKPAAQPEAEAPAAEPEPPPAEPESPAAESEAETVRISSTPEEPAVEPEAPTEPEPVAAAPEPEPSPAPPAPPEPPAEQPAPTPVMTPPPPAPEAQAPAPAEPSPAEPAPAAQAPPQVTPATPQREVSGRSWAALVAFAVAALAGLREIVKRRSAKRS